MVAGSLGGLALLAALGFAVAVPLLWRPATAATGLRTFAGAGGGRLEVADALRLAGRPADRHLTAAGGRRPAGCRTWTNWAPGAPG